MTSADAAARVATARVAASGVVRVGLVCSNSCIFCGVDGLDGLATSPEIALEALRAQTTSVTFVGGEPTLEPSALEALVDKAKALGFVRIGLQTNGAGLTSLLASRLASAGLTDVELSLLAADAAVHDYHTAQPGSFERAVSALRAARGAGLAVRVTTLLTRSSYRTLAALPQLLLVHGIEAWCIAVPHVAGRVGQTFDRVQPRLALAMPFALHAADAARKLGIPAFVAGAPLCLLGPFAVHAIRVAGGAFADECGTCTARARCDGVDPAYLARFAGDELDPRRAPPPAAPSAADAALASRFVGLAERGPALAPAATSAREARRALPMIERAVPGRTEVDRRGQQRTGDELRELFPQLFEGTLEGEGEPDPDP